LEPRHKKPWILPAKDDHPIFELWWIKRLTIAVQAFDSNDADLAAARHLLRRHCAHGLLPRYFAANSRIRVVEAWMTTPPQPDAPELPCFVPDDADPNDFELPMYISLKWDDDEDQVGLPDQSVPGAQLIRMATLGSVSSKE
jgi:hypothetical protein